MKKKIVICIILQFGFCFLLNAQNEFTPDLSQVENSDLWTLHNREVKAESIIYLNSKPNDGLLWIKEPVFTNGKIDLDIKGKDVKGKSFVGIAFHGQDSSTYDAIYFRPFNFKNPQKKNNSIQYISHPEHTWFKLRQKYPKKYENAVIPAPEPSEWFHVTVVVNYPSVKVYINHAKEPSLDINQISTHKKGWIGFWVGNNSDGYFKNLKIETQE